MAHDSNLDEEIGDTDNGFDPRWYFDNACESTMIDMAVKSSTKNLFTPREAIRDLVQNSESENVRVMRSEPSCVKKFGNKIKNCNYKWEHPSGWVMELVPKSKSDKKENGKGVAYIKVYHKDKDKQDEIMKKRGLRLVPINLNDLGRATKESGA